MLEEVFFSPVRRVVSVSSHLIIKCFLPSLENWFGSWIVVLYFMTCILKNWIFFIVLSFPVFGVFCICNNNAVNISCQFFKVSEKFRCSFKITMSLKFYYFICLSYLLICLGALKTTLTHTNYCRTKSQMLSFQR